MPLPETEQCALLTARLHQAVNTLATSSFPTHHRWASLAYKSHRHCLALLPSSNFTQEGWPHAVDFCIMPLHGASLLNAQTPGTLPPRCTSAFNAHGHPWHRGYTVLRLSPYHYRPPRHVCRAYAHHPRRSRRHQELLSRICTSHWRHTHRIRLEGHKICPIGCWSSIPTATSMTITLPSSITACVGSALHRPLASPCVDLAMETRIRQRHLCLHDCLRALA